MKNNKHDCGLKYDLIKDVCIGLSMALQMLILMTFEYKYTTKKGEKDYSPQIDPQWNLYLKVLGYVQVILAFLMYFISLFHRW
jgi:hypothetical protein